MKSLKNNFHPLETLGTEPILPDVNPMTIQLPSNVHPMCFGVNGPLHTFYNVNGELGQNKAQNKLKIWAAELNHHPSYWLSRGWQVQHQRWISGNNHNTCLPQRRIERQPSIALKPREEVNSNKKQGYQRTLKKTCKPKIYWENKKEMLLLFTMIRKEKASRSAWRLVIMALHPPHPIDYRANLIYTNV